MLICFVIAQGNQSIKVIGPVGLKGMVDLMSTHITKRNFPVIQVIEIGHTCYPFNSSIEDDQIHQAFLPEVTTSDSLTIYMTPVWSTVS